ncbi:transposase [Streptomyces sp. NPDC007896]|uniref:transposase n=1 Tax=Streptomyces sp. NPDC007896 TaxID=3364784 RepID=UPI0036E2AE4D
MSSCEEVGEESVLEATRITLGLLADRIGQLSEQIRDVEARLARLVDCHAPQLLEVVGIGPDTAVALLITVGDNPERLDSEASFAALRGVSPRYAARVPRSGRGLVRGVRRGLAGLRFAALDGVRMRVRMPLPDDNGLVPSALRRGVAPVIGSGVLSRFGGDDEPQGRVRGSELAELRCR